MTHGSLFSGIGGFDLGFEQAGIDTVWQVEIDLKARDTLSVHFNTERFPDVRECKGLEPVDVVSGGFPCQDLSVAGRHAGLAGERSGLWFEFHRILAELKPRWCVIENVPGLLSSNGGRDFAIILRGLVELGYGVCWRILDAQYFGVAQRRRRVFIVGSLTNFSCCQVLFESEGLSGNPATRRKAGKEVAYSLRANPSHSGDKGDGGVNTTPVAQTLRSRQSKPGVSMPGRGGEDDFNVIVSCLDSAPYADRAAEENKLIVNALDGAQGGPDDNMAQAGQLVPILAAGAGNSNGLGVGRAGHPMFTLDSTGSQSISSTMTGVRRLTPVECERLQGFPDGWTSMHKDTVRYSQIGNAVAVPVAEWIGLRIIEVNP